MKTFTATWKYFSFTVEAIDEEDARNTAWYCITDVDPAEVCFRHEIQITTPNQMKIYTYHDDVPELAHHQQGELLALWQERWSEQGWKPIILSEKEARKHELFPVLSAHIDGHLPSVNPKGYERACYLRWLALAVVGGGWMSDSDVFPYSFPPHHTEPSNMTIWSTGAPCPGLVSGSAKEYERIVRDLFLTQIGPTETINGQPHTSDQSIIQKHESRGRYLRIRLMSQFKEPFWDRYPVTHYTNDSMQELQPRHLYIPNLRPQQA